LLRICKRQI